MNTDKETAWQIASEIVELNNSLTVTAILANYIEREIARQNEAEAKN